MLVRYDDVLALGCHQPNAQLRKLIVPKSTKSVKGNVASRTHKSVTGAASQPALIALIPWTQRRDGAPLKRGFNIMGPPSDSTIPFVWLVYAGDR